jgi:O-methyltransferase involved in polyketide biosynthesis
MDEPQRIKLSPEQETLLITLYSKVLGCPGSIFDDPKSRQILDSIDYDFNSLDVPSGTSLTVCLRARKFDQYAREFIAAHPGCVIVHLGCGLDSRCTRVNHPGVDWYDLDFPGVIDLRKKFYEEIDGYCMIPSSVTDLGWVEAIGARNHDVLLIAEGLMMYLSEEEMKSLVLKLQQAFPGCSLTFDAYSTLTVRNIVLHPSIRKTGATIQWGVDDPKTLESWAPGIQFNEEWFFNQSPDIQKLSLSYRFIFWFTRMIPAARKAHRILYYTLS